MRIRSLELENFRNYDHLLISFDDETNILYGDNAQGKTNILEAIYFCAVSRSHKGSRDKDCISFQKNEAHIKCITEKEHFCDRIDIHLKKNQHKGIALNGVPLRRASELFGNLCAVFFSPEDLSIIKKGPADRRRFMDMELCQTDPYSTMNLSNFSRAVMQKNQLLKDIAAQPYLKDTLDVWNEQILKFGREVILARRRFIEECSPIIGQIHEKLTEGKEPLKVLYEPNVSEDDFEKKLLSEADRELRMKMSLVGPHRDDLSFLVDGADLRTFGSQGQQRTAALSLKLSEIEWIRKRKKENPVLLLDDVLSELDRNRQNKLLDFIQGIQTIITCTGVDDFVDSRCSVNRVFKVVNGTVREESLR